LSPLEIAAEPLDRPWHIRRKSSVANFDDLNTESGTRALVRYCEIDLAAIGSRFDPIIGSYWYGRLSRDNSRWRCGRDYSWYCGAPSRPAELVAAHGHCRGRRLGGLAVAKPPLNPMSNRQDEGHEKEEDANGGESEPRLRKKAREFACRCHGTGHGC